MCDLRFPNYIWICFLLLLIKDIAICNFDVSKRDENGERRRVHSEVLHSVYRPPNIFRVIKSRRWAGHVAKLEVGRTPLEMPTCRLEDNIRMGITKVMMNTRNWVDSAQDRGCLRALMKMILNHWS